MAFKKPIHADYYFKVFKHMSTEKPHTTHTFHGHYKDGTEPGIHDCHRFAAVYSFGRIIILHVIFGITLGVLCKGGSRLQNNRGIKCAHEFLATPTFWPRTLHDNRLQNGLHVPHS